MVKKKVVRRDSSKAKSSRANRNAVKHPKRKHHRIIHSLAKSKAEHIKSQAKVEELEMAAHNSVERSKALVPIKVEEPKVPEPVKAPEPEAEEIQPASVEVDDSRMVQPDPIVADDLSAEAAERIGGGDGSKRVRIAFFIISSIILLFWLILISASIVTNVDKIVERNTTVTVIEPITIDFEKYTNATTVLNTTEDSLIGYLREESVPSGAVTNTVYYIVDDYDNKLRLILDYQETRKYDLLFLTGMTSEKTYNVTGAFNYNQFNVQKYTFDVHNITRQDRPTHEIEVERLDNVTVKGKGFKIDITVGWKKLIKK